MTGKDDTDNRWQEETESGEVGGRQRRRRLLSLVAWVTVGNDAQTCVKWESQTTVKVTP